MYFLKFLSVRVNLTEHIYRSSDFNSSKYLLLVAESPESSESHGKFMAQLPYVIL